MPTEIHVKTMVGIVLVIAAIVLLVHGVNVAPEIMTDVFSYSVSGLILALLIWEKWGWSWRIFRPWMTTRPDLRGTWKGTIDSNYVDPATGNRMPPIEVYVAVRQTYSTIDVRLFSRESSSISLSAHLHSDNVDLYTLAVTYRNTPTVLRRGKSPISHGGMLLSVRGELRVRQLDGEYWTDRGTMGEIRLSMHNDQFASDFDHAKGLLNGAPAN